MLIFTQPDTREETSSHKLMAADHRLGVPRPSLSVKMAERRRDGEERTSGIGRASGFIIRPYRPGDFRDARRIFANGTVELVTVAFKRAVRSSSNVCLLLVGTGSVYGVTASLVCASLACLVLLALVYLACREVYHSYVRECLKTDMADIEGHYLKPLGAGFWVAEEAEGGGVVGTVAMMMEPGDPSSCQLVRMSVDQRFRRHGLGRRLARKVLEFTKAHGYRVCLLETSNAQEPAIHLYRKMGFEIQSSCHPGSHHAILNLLSKVSVCKFKQSL